MKTNEDDLINSFYKMYHEEMNLRNNDDYEVNKAQASRLINAYNFFNKIIQRDGGHIETLKYNPKEESCGVTFYTTLLYLYGDDILELAAIVSDMSALSIDSTIDGEVCVSFTIPEVFKLK